MGRALMGTLGPHGSGPNGPHGPWGQHSAKKLGTPSYLIPVDRADEKTPYIYIQVRNKKHGVSTYKGFIALLLLIEAVAAFFCWARAQRGALGTSRHDDLRLLMASPGAPVGDTSHNGRLTALHVRSGFRRRMLPVGTTCVFCPEVSLVDNFFWII